MGRVKALLNFIDAVAEWSGKIFQYFVYLLVGVVIYDVVMRYAFHTPTLWGFEVSYFLYGAFFMLGGAYTLLHKGHVRVDVLYSHLSLRTRAIIDSICYLALFFLFFGAILWGGLDYALTSWALGEHTASAWAPPLYWFKTVIPLAVFLLLLQGLAEFIRSLTLAVKGVKL